MNKYHVNTHEFITYSQTDTDLDAYTSTREPEHYTNKISVRETHSYTTRHGTSRHVTVNFAAAVVDLFLCNFFFFFLVSFRLRSEEFQFIVCVFVYGILHSCASIDSCQCCLVFAWFWFSGRLVQLTKLLAGLPFQHNQLTQQQHRPKERKQQKQQHKKKKS